MDSRAELDWVSTQWDDLFDRVYVVSLPSSADRRSYVAEHLLKNGITEFEWHDAVAPDHPDVRQLYADGKVHSYPPCFRCGQNSCGRDDCNNVLLPEQVANFATYLALWRKIADRNERVLVVEDDVRLHPAWSIVLPELSSEIASGNIQFAADQPCLLRMGWALGPDHDKTGPVRLDQVVRMSMPCYAITSAFAAKAVASFKSVYSTSDVYLHVDLPAEDEAFTVFPPIASELSWSTGEVSSLIHPKLVRVRYLDGIGERKSAEQEQERIAKHPQHRFHREFLVTGHPRTGTGYAASLLCQLGYDVGHEKAGADGISSWMFAADAERNCFAQDTIAASRRLLHWDVLLHIVRDPATAVASIMRDNTWSLPSYDFRRQHILEQTGIDLDSFPGNFERAVMSLVSWSRMILEMQPDFWFRLEDAHEALPRFLARTGRLKEGVAHSLDTTPVNANKPYKGERKPLPIVSDDAWAKLSDTALEGLKWYCDRFGYPLPGTLGKTQAAIAAPEPAAVAPLGKLFLGPSGWERSRQEERPVSADGRALPWFTYGAIEFLTQVVDGGMRVFEYGAGYSTLWWQRAAQVHSVDHDPAWVSELRPKLGPNAALSLIEHGAPASPEAEAVLAQFRTRPRRTEWDYPAERVVRRGLEDDGFLAYASHICTSGKPYDVIVIDGMARRLCTEFAVKCLTDTGFIVFDNSNRRDYDAAYDILQEEGFFQIPFWGLVPGASFQTCTSIFARQPDFLPDARFRSNSFGLPEY